MTIINNFFQTFTFILQSKYLHNNIKNKLQKKGKRMNKYNDKNDWCYTVDDYEEDDDWLDLINNHVHLSKCSFVESLMIIFDEM